MQKLKVDSGVQQYRLHSGVLQFNPADPNLYARFLQAADRLEQLQAQMLQAAEAGEELTQLLTRTDRQIKQELNKVFGPENDFDKLLGGVNVFAPGHNGESVLVNLFTVLQSVLEEGVRRWTQVSVQKAVEASKRRKQS